MSDTSETLAHRPALSPRSKHFVKWLLAITAAALILRLIVSAQLAAGYSPVTRPAPATDMHTYMQLGAQVADGTYPYEDGYYYQPFYYGVFLPLIYKIFGQGHWPLIIAQSLLGAACVLLTGLAAARLFGRRAGLAAAVLLALCRFHVFYTPMALIAILQSFWISLLLYCSLIAASRKSLKWWTACGLICGMSIVTRGNMQLFIPLLLGLILVRQFRDGRRAALTACIALVIATQLPQLPFSVVNYNAKGTWTGPSTAAAAVLALGNTPEAPPGGREPGTGAGPMEYPTTCNAWMDLTAPDHPQHTPMSTSIRRWAMAEPLVFVELKWRMLLLFWNRAEVPNNVAIEAFGKPAPSSLLHLPILLDFWLIGGLGLAGLLLTLARRRHRTSAVYTAGVVILYCISIVVFYILARFRVPILPVLCVFGGYTIITMHRRFGEKDGDGRRRIVDAVLAAAAFVVVAMGFDAYRYGWESRVMAIIRPDGMTIELPHETLIKDNGPLSFGGWLPLPLNEPRTILKTLTSGTAGGQAAIRLAVSAERQATVKISGTEHTLKPGINWLTIPADQLTPSLSGGQTTFTILVGQASAPAYIFVDSQRQYGRTTINGQPADGELVVELHIRGQQ
jgi:4-amino-4-deoxy-L-arabinose transferase-like glycosyltransferase